VRGQIPKEGKSEGTAIAGGGREEEGSTIQARRGLARTEKDWGAGHLKKKKLTKKNKETKTRMGLLTGGGFIIQRRSTTVEKKVRNQEGTVSRTHKTRGSKSEIKKRQRGAQIISHSVRSKEVGWGGILQPVRNLKERVVLGKKQDLEKTTP